MSYKIIANLNRYQYGDKKVLIVGGGNMGRIYCKALRSMGVRQITVVSRSHESAERCRKEFGVKTKEGGFEKFRTKGELFDLVIIAMQVHDLKRTTEWALSQNMSNILVEKPGGFTSVGLAAWAKEVDDLDSCIRVAYNRICYPSLWKAQELCLADGGITSCRYTFTELVHKFTLNSFSENVLERLGIANSLHVIGMAHYLIGMPSQTSSYQEGSLSWHASGSRFVGSGSTKKNVLFSYHADWKSPGRWSVELWTARNAYRLIPLEQLYVCSKDGCFKGSMKWDPVDFSVAYPEVKPGVAEEIALMLFPDLEQQVPLITLRQASELTLLGEKIFGYQLSRNLKANKRVKQEHVKN